MKINIPFNLIYQWYKNTLKNSKYRWLLILGTLVYLFSPFDIVPDIFPLVGQIDDLTILTLLLTEIFQMLLEKAKSLKTAPQKKEEGTTVDVEAFPLE